MELTADGLQGMNAAERAVALQYLRSSAMAKHLPHVDQVRAALELEVVPGHRTRMAIGDVMLVVDPGNGFREDDPNRMFWESDDQGWRE
jgi:hypothetical protein